MTRLEIYDELYAKAKALNDKYQPCEHDECGHCMMPGGCCTGCTYLSKHGCTTESLLCKLWVCWKATDDCEPVFIEELKKIYEIAKRNNILVARGGRGDVREEYDSNEYTMKSFDMPWNKWGLEILPVPNRNLRKI